MGEASFEVSSVPFLLLKLKILRKISFERP